MGCKPTGSSSRGIRESLLGTAPHALERCRDASSNSRIRGEVPAGAGGEISTVARASPKSQRRRSARGPVRRIASWWLLARSKNRSKEEPLLPTILRASDFYGLYT